MSHISLNKFWSTVTTIIVASVALFAASSAYALWDQNEPQGFFGTYNIETPIHTGDTEQSKSGPNGSFTIFNFPNPGGIDRASLKTGFIWGGKQQVTENKIIADDFCILDSSGTFYDMATNADNDCAGGSFNWPAEVAPPATIMPTGTDNQTLRYEEDTSEWLANSGLVANEANRVRIGDWSNSDPFHPWFDNHDFMVSDDSLLMYDNYMSVGTGSRTTVGNGPGFIWPDTTLDTSTKLAVNGNTQLRGKTFLGDWDQTFSNLLTLFTPPQPSAIESGFFDRHDLAVAKDTILMENAFLSPSNNGGATYIGASIWPDTNIDPDTKLIVEGNTILERTVIKGGNLFSGWDADFQWGGGGGDFTVDTNADFGNDVVVDQLAHAASSPRPVCATDNGKLILCDGSHGTQMYTAYTTGFPDFDLMYRTTGTLGENESSQPLTFATPSGVVDGFTIELWGAGGGGAGGRSVQDYDGSSPNGGSGGGGGGAGDYTIATGVNLASGGVYNVTSGIRGLAGRGADCKLSGTCYNPNHATSGTTGGFSKFANAPGTPWVWKEAKGGEGGYISPQDSNNVGSGGENGYYGTNTGGTTTNGTNGGNPSTSGCNQPIQSKGGQGGVTPNGSSSNAASSGHCTQINGGQGGNATGYGNGGGGGGGANGNVFGNRLKGGNGGVGGYGYVKITW